MSPEQPSSTPSRGAQAARRAALALRDPVLAVGVVSVLAVGLVLAGVSRAYTADRIEQSARERGADAVRMVQEMQGLVGRLASADELVRQEQTNLFYNRKIRYTSDQRLYQQVDYWASPLETFAQGRGDCEDYAIAKYFTLLAGGIPPAKLRMVYVKADLPATSTRPAESVGHMVLAYYPQPDADPLVLDNLTDEIRPASLRPDLKPVFSFNTEGLWQGVGQQSMGDPMARISKWRDAMNRIKAEGF
jgi:predicted transglutaminase-like cysteine proteinase